MAVLPTIERTGRTPRAGVIIIAGFGNPVAADYATFVSQNSPVETLVVDEPIQRLLTSSVRSMSVAEFSRSTASTGGHRDRAQSAVLFITSRLTRDQRRELDDILALTRRAQARFIGIVSTFRFHLDDPDVESVENDVRFRCSGSGARVIIFRPGHILSRHSRTSWFLNNCAPFFPLLPKRLTSCFVEGTELFAAIETERLHERTAPARMIRASAAKRRTCVNPPADRWVLKIGTMRSWRQRTLA